jgi:DNA polymerase III alpha subunit
MINIALKTEYSFKACYGRVKDTVNFGKENGATAIGIADINNTYGHYQFNKECESEGIKPIFGVRLSTLSNGSKQRTANLPWVYLAKNDDGLVEIYKLVNRAYDRFYYTPRIFVDDALAVSENVVVLSPFKIDIDVLRAGKEPYNGAFLGGLVYYDIRTGKTIAVGDNHYITPDQRPVYQTLGGASKRGDDYIYSFDNKTYPIHIMSEDEWKWETLDKSIIQNTNELAEECNAKLKAAPMISYDTGSTILQKCKIGARRLKIDLTNPEYKERLEYEIEIIEKRGFQDYFFIVADLLMEAKQYCLVGPGRGSSGGSLVCYLMGITEIDPIEYKLIFERFVDLNRVGLPDVDTDIPDAYRQRVIKYLISKYGTDNVRSIGIISTLKPRSAISNVAKILNIPIDIVESVKESVVERQGGDDRADSCISDTFSGTEIGRDVIEKYPKLLLSEKIENHAHHAGKHAAGVIVSNEPLYNYAGIDSRESTIMLTGQEAESQGLLKIDVLGLRTLSVLQETAKLGGFNYKDFYKIPLDDKKVFQIFNDDRVYGIFQFEGSSTRNLVRRVTIENFEDICAATALSRPGALISRQTDKYVRRKNGEDEPVYFGKIHKEITESTYGSVVYQEQGMELMRRYGGMTWSDINILRKAISKSYGDAFFAKYKEAFMTGAKKNVSNEEEIDAVWQSLASMGSYSFNKSHAVAYSFVSYWCAWAKEYYPLEFAAANLNNAKDDKTSVKILRDFVTNDNIEYIALDPDMSDVKWSIYDGKLIGGLTSISGIGVAKAKDIIKMRKGLKKFTPSVINKLMNPVTPFDILFPTEHFFGKYYSDPITCGLNKKPDLIKDIDDPGNYLFIGQVLHKDMIFRNTPQLVVKRGGTLLEDNLYYLKIIVEDDTADIMAMIPPFLFDELDGRSLHEKIIEDKTWVIIKGKVQSDFRMISIEAIQILEKE